MRRLLPTLALVALLAPAAGAAPGSQVDLDTQLRPDGTAARRLVVTTYVPNLFGEGRSFAFFPTEGGWVAALPEEGDRVVHSTGREGAPLGESLVPGEQVALAEEPSWIFRYHTLQGTYRPDLGMPRRVGEAEQAVEAYQPLVRAGLEQAGVDTSKVPPLVVGVLARAIDSRSPEAERDREALESLRSAAVHYRVSFPGWLVEAPGASLQEGAAVFTGRAAEPLEIRLVYRTLDPLRAGLAAAGVLLVCLGLGALVRGR